MAEEPERDADHIRLRAEVAGHYWWHSIDVGNGVVTPGKKPLELIARESSLFFDPVDLTGLSVIDIGAWNGAYSFEAKRRGAARVLATDSFVWNHPQFRGREAFELARREIRLDIEACDIDVMDIHPAAVGTADVVLFLGVFYHLQEPMRGLANAARLARQLLIVETALDLEGIDRPAMAYYPGSELSKDDTNWWGPNIAGMEALLRTNGFEMIDARANDGRGIFHAWRDTTHRRPEGLRPWDREEYIRRSKRRLGFRLLRQAFGLDARR